MEVISSKRFILLTLAILSSLTSNIFCADELMMSNLHSKENYDKYVEPKGDPTGEKERSLNFEEVKDWGPEPITKMSTPPVNIMPHPAADLPLRFRRTTEENRSTGAMASLPLRFGKNTKESISRHVPNLPQRFGRTAARSVTKTLSDLLQESMPSLSANELFCSMTCEPQEIQNPYQKHLRYRWNPVNMYGQLNRAGSVETGIQENV